MIFLPNNFARYTAALRNTVQLSVIKRGICEKSIKNLMKIHKAEALYGQNTEPVCIGGFSEALLCAAFFTLLEKGEKLYYSVNIRGNFLIDRKLYTALLLTVCKVSRKISIEMLRERIVIKAKAKNVNPVLPFIKAFDAVYLFEIKSETLLIAITADHTDKRPISCYSECDYILNPFSEVNIYLS